MPNQTRLVIEDYIFHKIITSCSSDLPGISKLQLAKCQENPSAINKAVRTMVDQYAYEHDKYFSKIFENTIVTANMDVNKQLSAVATRMFDLPLKPLENKNPSHSSPGTGLDDSHITWGQVITLLIFASNFAVKAVECDALEKVYEIISWLTHFIDTDLSFWLAKQGGWNDFYHWSEITIGQRDTNKKDSCGSTASGLQKAMSVGVVAACAGLLFMISQK